MKISRIHPFNGNINILDLNTTLLEFDNYRAGMCAQDAFPNLTPDEREFIITGIYRENGIHILTVWAVIFTDKSGSMAASRPRAEICNITNVNNTALQ